MSIGQGALRVTVGYPSGLLTHGYRDSTPRLSVDGVEHTDITWGEHVFALPAGPHTVRILVYGKRREPFGLAEARVTIGLGKRTDLVYRAPRWHGARGMITVSASRRETQGS